MTHSAQERHSDSTTQTSSAPPVAGTQPITPHARAYASRHGDPEEWKPEHFRTYLELGGAS
ncbi:hypothetical protein [Streptomyces griseorubiginosus]|uniref:hypothetical protein n=1 Tax=Streptomyces griseorubiginosus TaxID=67304 RepID=UPI0036EF6C50